MTEISKYITIIRPEFMTFCKDACRAAALNHLLFRIAYKCKDQPREKIQAGEVLWYAKTELITAEMSDAWGVCKVRKEVNALLAMNLFGKKNNPTWGVDRTKHFYFGSEQCQVFINLCKENGVCIVHLDLPTEVRHLIYSSLASDTSIKCCCEKQEDEQANDKSIACIRYNHPMHSINLSPANDISIEAITKITTKRSTEDNHEEEGTYSAGEENSMPTIGADAPTPAPDTQSSSHEPVYSLDQGLEQPYTPNFQADQEKIRRASDAPAQGSTRDTTPAVAPSGPVQAVGYEKPAQATSQAAAPQRQSAYQAPPRGRGNKPKGNSSKQIYFSTEGSAFRGWYEGCMGYELDVTAANAAAYNKLGRKQGVSQATVQDVLERIQADKWLREHNIVVTVQDLASDTHKYRWEYWYQLIKQCQRAAKAVSHVPTREEDPYSIAALVEQQNPGYFARMEELQNTWKN